MPASHQPATARASASPGWTTAQLLGLTAIGLGLLMAQVDTTVVNLALADIRAQLGASVAALQWIVDGYNLVFAALLLTGGALGDLFGRRRMVVWGLALFTAGSLTCALASAPGLVVVGRIVQGVGAALELPGTLSIIGVLFPEPRQRAQAMGIWSAVFGLAMAIGPTVGGVLLGAFGWHSIFLVNVPLGIAAIVLALARLPENARPAGRSVDLPGQLAALLALGGLTFAAVESQPLGLSSAPVVAAAVVAVAALVAFVSVEGRSRDPMLALNLFRNPAFSLAGFEAAAMTFGMYGLLFLLPLTLQVAEHESALAAGLQIVPMSITYIVTAPLAGRLEARIGPRPLMLPGMLIMGGGLIVTAALAPVGSPLALSVIFAVVGVGLGLNTGPVIGLAVASVPEDRAGMASGFINTARMTGSTLGVAAAGTILASRLTPVAGAHGYVAGLQLALALGGAVHLFAGALIGAWLVWDRPSLDELASRLRGSGRGGAEVAG